MRWEASDSAFRLGGVSGPSNDRDLCETPSGLGDAWLEEQSWHFPREGSCCFAVGLRSTVHRAARRSHSCCSSSAGAPVSSTGWKCWDSYQLLTVDEC